MTPFEFENWRNGHQARVYYDSGQVTNGKIAANGVPPGSYILAFSNGFSRFSRKASRLPSLASSIPNVNRRSSWFLFRSPIQAEEPPHRKGSVDTPWNA